MTKIKPVGRPKLPRSRAKSYILHVRLQEAEKEQLEKKAAGDGLSLSQWIRKVIDKALKI